MTREAALFFSTCSDGSGLLLSTARNCRYISCEQFVSIYYSAEREVCHLPLVYLIPEGPSDALRTA